MNTPRSSTTAFNTLKAFLDRKVLEYNNLRFIDTDPILIPHRFRIKQDIEIAAFFSALIAWGQRTTIIQNATRILHAMDNAPYQFITQHEEIDLKKMLDIKHRTLNATDLLYFIHFLKQHYLKFESLENAFLQTEQTSMRERMVHFHDYVFSFEAPQRSRKHIGTPLKNSACKRMNMMLRWMVRKDDAGVDFGLWQQIQTNELICPMDVHVSNVAHRLGLIEENKANWKTAEQLTERLKEMNPTDPCRYDFALFALGAEERLR